MKIAYTLFSWLITCIGGSILLLATLPLMGGGLGHLLDNATSEGAWFVLVYGSFAALLFSLPAFMLYHMIGALLYRKIQELPLVKTLLSVYALLAPLLTLTVVVGEKELFRNADDLQALYLLLPYIACFVTCVWLFAPRHHDDEPQEEVSAGQGDFPGSIIAAVAIIVVITLVWSLVNLLSYWQVYHLKDLFLSLLVLGVQITGLIWLLRRKHAGWYILLVLAICFTLTSLLGLGYAFFKKPEYLQAYSNIGRLFFFLLDVVYLVLLLLPAVRRYFSITAGILRLVLLAGGLLALVLFFFRLQT